MPVKIGDIWQLGKHKLLCADASDKNAISQLMAGEKADMVFTSPPYNQQRQYYNPIANWDALMAGVFSDLPVKDDAQILINLGMYRKKGNLERYWEHFLDWMVEQGWRFFDWYVWDKLSPFPGNFGGHLIPQHEWFFHFNKNARQAKKTIPTIQAGSIRPSRRIRQAAHDTLQFQIAHSLVVQEKKVASSVIQICKQNREIDPNIIHPAVFPVALPEYLIPIWTEKDEIVYEPFCGSGSTIVACENIGRVCRAVEIAPEYCDMILLRFKKLYPSICIQKVGSEEVDAA